MHPVSNPGYYPESWLLSIKEKWCLKKQIFSKGFPNRFRLALIDGTWQPPELQLNTPSL